MSPPPADDRLVPVAVPAALRDELAGLALASDASTLDRASRDYHWYSPVLTRALAGCQPGLVVRPRDEAEVRRLAAACARHRVPLTVRGGGTGNYGQCVPRAGGVVMDATGLDRILELEAGRARVQAGVLLHVLDTTARAWRPVPQQLRMFPSTARIATVGGFIAGGHSGIGSMRHGILKDPGNVSRIRVLTLEPEPQVLTLHGAEIQQVHHAYGTNGILLDLDLALTDAVEWQHTITLFDSYAALLRFGLAAGALAVAGGGRPDAELDLFQLSAVERRITPYYAGLRDRLEDRDAMFAQVSPATLARYRALAARMGGRVVVAGTEAELLAAGLPSATECAYNHTTLEALKSDPHVTYLQVAFPAPLDVGLVERLMDEFGDEVMFHHEFSQAGGELVAFALPLLQYFDEARLREVAAAFEAAGCELYDPHTWWIEDGGMKTVDASQIAFKRRADPLGLMNPGKTRGWTG